MSFDGSLATERKITLNTYRKFRLYSALLPLIMIMSFIPWGEVNSLPVTKMNVGPVNPSASVEAQELLSYLVGLSGKGILSGQHDYLERPDDYNAKLKDTSGQYAVLHGYELGAINNQSKKTAALERQAVVKSAIDWYNNGGIVAMTFHQNLPGTPAAWSNVSKGLSQEDFNAYVTPGTPQYKSLIADLDQIAIYLKQLRDAGVPVIWRPYHEMNGGWFWWGKKSNFKALWNIMYDRFVDTHKLNNLLWTWNPNAPNEWSDPYLPYYPGSDKVDILGADIYNNDYNQVYYDSLLELANGKPIGIGESGELPDPEMMALYQSKWVYMMTWGKMLTEKNSTQKIKNFMSSTHTVSRDKLVSRLPVKNQPTVKPTNPPVKNTAHNSLSGDYFNNIELAGKPALSRKDNKIDFNWRGGSPGSAIENDSFSVRWKGKIKPQFSEKYTFYASSDDGVRVWVGNKLLIDSWNKQSGVTRQGSITLNAGTLYNIKVEYFENHGDASIRLKWKSPHLKEAVIPQSALFSP
ncbi:glycosyl hydrolase [Paenibacillus wynnii]|uniref:glycosyl hydrolase n=1 Tax=Paenibacillus wynnii TaxID=268407 RepID=UPI00068A12A4|nr:glycosyl hydrolase [Paenibacillus wynnii]